MSATSLWRHSTTHTSVTSDFSLDGRFQGIPGWIVLTFNTGMSNLTSKLGQICPKWDKSGTFQISFSIFWTETVLKKSQIYPIWSQSELILMLNSTSLFLTSDWGDVYKNWKFKSFQRSCVKWNFVCVCIALSIYLKNFQKVYSWRSFLKNRSSKCTYLSHLIPHSIWAQSKISGVNLLNLIPQLTKQMSLSRFESTSCVNVFGSLFKHANGHTNSQTTLNCQYC